MACVGEKANCRKTECICKQTADSERRSVVMGKVDESAAHQRPDDREDTTLTAADYIRKAARLLLALCSNAMRVDCGSWISRKWTTGSSGGGKY